MNIVWVKKGNKNKRAFKVENKLVDFHDKQFTVWGRCLILSTHFMLTILFDPYC